MTKIFVICPTYRDNNDIVSANFRMFGIVHLIKQINNQAGSYNIKLCIVDSSSEIHPFFKKYENSFDNLLYFHITNRNNISNDIKYNYKESIKFIPIDNDFYKKKWKNIIKKAIAWDDIFPWDKDYIIKTKIKNQIYNTRPTIGMKRNFAISVLTERFGEADYIIYADDDDFRSNLYVNDLINGIKNFDFGRFFKYYVWSISKNNELYGINNVKFFKDINGNWLLQKQSKNQKLFNTTSCYNNTLYNKYSILIGLAFPFISFEGATQIFKYSIWEKMLKYTNGIPITSMCEDVIFFKECKKYLGINFRETEIKINNINFLRVNNGNNTSIIEWTKNIKYNNLPAWITDILKDYKKVLNISNINDYYSYLYDNFVLNNLIIF